MQLNQLYGIFGRKQESITTININKKDLSDYITTRIVKNIIEINDDIVTLLVSSNLNFDILKNLNYEFLDDKYNFTNVFTLDVKSNVAIASTVTSYARIFMMEFKTDPDIEIVYTDTDSLITEGRLKPTYIGEEIGQFKDEMNGLVINEGIFLGIKEYGYTYINKNGDKIDKSVFAGVPRDSLSFYEIKKILKGETITKEVPIRFHKSLKDLSITSKNVKINIKKNCDKKLIDNKYIPLTINEMNHEFDNRSIFIKIKNRIINLIRKYLKIH